MGKKSVNLPDCFFFIHYVHLNWNIFFCMNFHNFDGLLLLVFITRKYNVTTKQTKNSYKR